MRTNNSFSEPKAEFDFYNQIYLQNGNGEPTDPPPDEDPDDPPPDDPNKPPEPDPPGRY